MISTFFSSKAFASLLVLATLTLALVFPVQAQEDFGPDRTDDNGNTFEQTMAGYKAKTLKTTVPYSTCKGSEIKLSLNYPESGNKMVDQALRRLLEQKARSEVQAPSSPNDCTSISGGPIRGEYSVTFQAALLLNHYLSIRFTEFSMSSRMAHPNTDYFSLTFDLDSGHQINLSDIFPNRSEALPQFWKLASKIWCQEKGMEKVPSFYGVNTPCSSPRRGLPPKLSSAGEDINALGHPLLKSDSITLMLNGYDILYYAFGPREVKLPLENLMDIGYNPNFWMVPQ
ncbi:MAG: hypothetical protein LBV23_04330 [Deltaproteobacteria bacterium]|jgi:hypothetical protein|nr:hypothetical protein [Deltaproteobacteria bacterium]